MKATIETGTHSHKNTPTLGTTAVVIRTAIISILSTIVVVSLVTPPSVSATDCINSAEQIAVCQQQ